MLKKTITYTDYNGVERKEDFYFNLTKAELMDMQLTTVGSYTEMVKAIIDTKDIPQLIKLFKEIILKSYGIKSPDGKRFMKSEEISREFAETEAYSILYMELVTDEKAGADFVNNIVPADLAAEAKKMQENGEIPLIDTAK